MDLIRAQRERDWTTLLVDDHQIIIPERQEFIFPLRVVSIDPLDLRSSSLGVEKDHTLEIVRIDGSTIFILLGRLGVGEELA